MVTNALLDSTRAASRACDVAIASLQLLSDACAAERGGSTPIRLKRAPTGEGKFSGYASVFGNVDSYGDVVQPGAFAKSLAKTSVRPLLWQHDPNAPIGIIRLKEDAYGLLADGELTMEVQRAREAAALLKDGVIAGMSIGYRTEKEERRGNVNYLTQINLLEVSIVTFPANAAARVDLTTLKGDANAFMRILAQDLRGVPMR